MVLQNQLSFTAGCNKEYSDKFGVEGAKIGTTLNLRKPPRYVGRTGQTLSVENSVDQSMALTLTTQFGVDIGFTSADLKLNIDDFSNRYIKPAIATVANKIDYDGLQLYKEVYNQVGTPGTTPATLLPFLMGGVKMTNAGAPVDGQRYSCVNPLTEAVMVNAHTGLFNPNAAISEQYMKGKMGTAVGFEWNMDQNVAVHTHGTATAATTTTADGTLGATTIAVATGTGTTFAVGDTFNFEAVNAVNPQNRMSVGLPQDFVITAVAANSISFQPPLNFSGQFQNIDAKPLSGCDVTPVNTTASKQSPQSLLYHRNAFTLGTADLPLPGGVDMAARVSDPETGLSIRMIRAYDIVSDLWPCRLDILYGWKTVYPEFACRVMG